MLVLLRLAIVLSMSLGLSLLAAVGRCSEPKSGFVESVLYSVDASGKPYGQNRVARIWFDEHNTRLEEQIGNDITSVRVEGHHNWNAYPAAQRYLSSSFLPAKTGRPSAPFVSYPATIRNSYARSEQKQPFIAKGVMHNLPAWKYTWHRPATWAGDVGSGSQDGVIWILADADFPLVLQNDTVAGERITSRSEILNFQRDIPVPSSLFELPRGYKPILLTTLPTSEFRLQVETTYMSGANVWQTRGIDVFTGQAQQVLHQCSSTRREANGNETLFTPPDETLTWERGKIEFLREVQTPYWGVMKKVGTERILNLEADIVESVAEGVSEKFWIVNHPLFGTISLRRESPMSGDRAITRVLALEANSVLKR